MRTSPKANMQHKSQKVQQIPPSFKPNIEVKVLVKKYQNPPDIKNNIRGFWNIH